MKPTYPAKTTAQTSSLTVSAQTAHILEPLKTAALQTASLGENRRSTQQPASSAQPTAKKRPTGPIHRIIQGEALEMMAKIPDQSIDFICADFPYNISGKGGLTMSGSNLVAADFGEWDKFPSEDAYIEFVFKVSTEYRRILKPNASMVLFF